MNENTNGSEYPENEHMADEFNSRDELPVPADNDISDNVSAKSLDSDLPETYEQFENSTAHDFEQVTSALSEGTDGESPSHASPVFSESVSADGAEHLASDLAEDPDADDLDTDAAELLSSSGTTESETASGPEIDSDTESWSDPIYRKSERDKVYSPNHYGEKNGYGSYQQPIYRSPAPEKKQPGRFRSAVALILVCALVSSLFSGLAAWFVTDYKINHSDLEKQVVLGSSVASPVSSDKSSTEDQAQYTGDKLSGSQIYKLALKQVVGVNSEKTTNIFGQPTTYPVSGSGFVISEDGYILTNYHVIEYAVLYDFDLKVMFNDGTEYPAKIIGYEEQNDVAVIKIDASGLSPVTFANSDNMSVGDWVYPVGNPLGELSYSMTYGIVSARDRVISTDKTTNINMFQIDAAVNKGNSGGPVYNEYGEVLGIVTAKYSDDGVEGLGFAIPINDVLDIVTQLIKTGYISGKAKLGISVQTVDNSFASYYNVPLGAYIMDIEKGSCAEKAGLKIGDIITAIGGQKVTTKEELISGLKNYKAGDSVTLTVYRSGEETNVSAVLDEKLPVD